MTNSFLAEFDAPAHAAFADAGIADTVQYTPADRTRASRPARVFVDRASTSQGFGAQVDAPSITVRVLLADTDGTAPGVGAVFDLGDVRHVVDRVLDQDESTATCIVSREIAR